MLFVNFFEYPIDRYHKIRRRNWTSQTRVNMDALIEATMEVRQDVSKIMCQMTNMDWRISSFDSRMINMEGSHNSSTSTPYQATLSGNAKNPSTTIPPKNFHQICNAILRENVPLSYTYANSNQTTSFTLRLCQIQYYHDPSI